MAFDPNANPFTPTGVPGNLTVGKLGYESVPFDLPFKARSGAPAQVGPDNIYEFMRQIWQPGYLEHEFAQNLLLWAFNAPVQDGWMNNLDVSHSARITFKKWMNPLNRFRRAELSYKDGVECPKQLDLDCVIPPAGPLDDFQQVDVDFKFEYSIRIDTCIKTRRLTGAETERNWAESVQAVTYGRAIDAWNRLAQQIIDSEAPLLKQAFVTRLGATNYVDAGTADFYETLCLVLTYMARVFGPRFKRDFLITIHPDLALDIMVNHSDLLAYNITGVRQDWIQVDQTAFGTFDILPTLPRLKDYTILIAPDDIAFENELPTGYAGTATTVSPWENEDGTKVRLLIASRRSYFTKTIQLLPMTMFPATVEHPVESLVEIWMGGDKLIYPEETFLVEFDRP